MRAWLVALALSFATRASAAPEDEDKDLALIPEAAPRPAASPVDSAAAWKLDVEDAATLAARRSVEVPFPAPAPYDRQNRTSLDAVVEWRASTSIKLVTSNRADLIEQQGVALWSGQTVHDELREAYASWQPIERTYLELGRINVRDGVALGFNPTDFLRPRTLVGQASLDPSVLSRNRLGTLMVRAESIWEGGSASALFAPKLFAPPAITTSAIGIDPRFDATNAANRGLATVSWNVGSISVLSLVYLEHHHSKLGLALTRPIGQRVVAYAEWAGGYEQNLIARALELGRQTATIPEDAPPPVPTDSSLALRNDLAAGTSWTLGTALTLNFEYHLHQGGLSRGDWHRWFAAAGSTPALAPELWYIRGYAADQLEPATRHELFVRMSWPKAILDHLELAAFAFVNLGDGSTLVQVTASYYASDAWTVGLALSGNAGPTQSERGSLPQLFSGIVDLTRYL
jgi:hypothetical protein